MALFTPQTEPLHPHFPSVFRKHQSGLPPRVHQHGKLLVHSPRHMRYNGKRWTPGRRHINVVAAILCLVLPVVLFYVVSWAMSFSIRYSMPELCWCIVQCAGIIVLVCGAFAVQAFRRRHAIDGYGRHREPTWFIFLFVSMLIAFVAATVLGWFNHAVDLRYYYDLVSLHAYAGLDPGIVDGQSVMDSGRLLFSRDTHLEVAQATAHKHVDTYCAAPIVSGDSNHSHIDFWAVGVNCCSGQPGDFSCGEVKNGNARGGVRWLHSTEELHYFRLAVEQAEARYHMKARHPIFVTWCSDPVGEMNIYRDRGVKRFWFWFLMFFSWQLLFLTLMLMIFVNKL